MAVSNLSKIFQRLCQGSVDSVQSGETLGILDSYLHIDRPIENEIKNKMSLIQKEGGGIILLIGSAGDGKSHIISSLKKNYTDFNFYNDATVSYSPQKTAVETLCIALDNFNDNNINQTNQKLLLAINLGKLNALIDYEPFKTNFNTLVKTIKPLFGDNKQIIEQSKIKVVIFTDYQNFEFLKNDNSDYPIKSSFLLGILDKITNQTDKNPFYKAYLEDKKSNNNDKDPLILNYELLMNEKVKDSIVKYVIEAIIRFHLNVTPREYFDFIYSIICYPKKYSQKSDFFEALIPSLLFENGDNKIQKAISLLDPVKNNNREHDTDLSLLFTSFEIKLTSLFNENLIKIIPNSIIELTDKFYQNRGKDVERISRFYLRLKHLLSYHSDSKIYLNYLSVLRGIYNQDNKVMGELYNLVMKSIPRHYGSYFTKEKENLIPLDIQGSNYKLFVKLKIKPQPIKFPLSDNCLSKFPLSFDMSWNCNGDQISLFMNYQLYEYLSLLEKGRFAVSYNNDRDIAFSKFLRDLAEKSDQSEEVIFYSVEDKEFTLTESLGSIKLL